MFVSSFQNLHLLPRLKRYSGKDPRVAKYIRSFPQTAEFLQRIEGLLVYLIPLYIREGELFHNRVWLHWRQASLGDARGIGEKNIGAEGISDKSDSPRHGEIISR